jgi:hypothetical protein
MRSLHLTGLLSILLFFANPLLLRSEDTEPAQDGPALNIDVSSDRHPISPYIYGMAYPDQALAKELSLPLRRWGGDGTTRYNWKTDTTNSGDDFYFIGGTHDAHNPPGPSAGPDKMMNEAKDSHGRVLLTMPFIDYVDNSAGVDCSFPVSIFGPQQKVNPYVRPIINGRQTNAGNGRDTSGRLLPILTKDQALRNMVENTPDFESGWVQHMVDTFGTTDKGGVAFWEMDNEPDGWTNTHHDIRDKPIGHDEQVQKTIDYASMIKKIDPSAQIVAPGDFVMHYFFNQGKPGDGAAEHGGEIQTTYFLKKMKDYEDQNHQRLLDYFDEHYYSGDHGPGKSDDLILSSTRSLWDPTYKENNMWANRLGGPIKLIPQFHEWVDKYYPGTKISISEYGWGDMKKFIYALSKTEVLEIFGREKLDMACDFGGAKQADVGANAFRMYLNYDGQGGKYGDTWVQSKSDDQNKLAVYGAQRSSDKTLTLVVINKTTGDLKSNVSLNGFNSSGSAKVYLFSAADQTKLVPQLNQAISGTSFTSTFPARSATMIAIPGN